MALTAQLGTVNSKPINLELGRNAVIQPLATATPPTLVVEMAWASDPVQSAGYYFNVLNDGPVAYWRMDNQATLTDQTGSGNTMTVEGTPTLATTLVSGDGNQATLFNGSSQDAYAPSSAGLSPTGAFGFERWLKTASSLPGATVDHVQKRGMYGLQRTTDGRLVFWVKNGTNNPSVTSNTALATSTSYLVGCAYDGTHLYIYLNGVLDAATGYSLGLESVSSRFKLAGGDNSSASPTYGTNAFAGASASTAISVNKPASTADGDYLVAQIAVTPYTAGVQTVAAAPAGWTLLESTSTNNCNMYAYGKIASGEPANWTWTLTGSANVLGSVSRYTGVSSVVPVGSVSSATTASGTTVAPSLLPAFDNTMIVSLFGARAFGNTWTESAGTERLDYNPGSNTSIAINTLAVGSSSLQTNTGTSNISGELHGIQIELVGTLSSTYTSETADEVSVFNYAPTAAQFQNHYLQAITPPPTITWTDITSDVKQVSITRGRQYELNRIEAGTASLTLNDDLRKYDPANTSSPYAPNVIPMRMIRVRALFNAVYYPLFQGYVERFESQWNAEWLNHVECNVTAVDGFEPLSLTVSPGTIQSTLSGTTIANLLGRANWSALNRSLDMGAFVTETFNPTGSILDAIQTVAGGENGVFFINPSGFAVFHDKNHRSTTSTSTTSQATFGDQTLGSLPYTALVPSKDKDHIVNDWTVTDGDGGDHQATDSASMTRYFHRSSSMTTYLNSADAATMAAYLLALTKEPGYRFDEMELCPNTTLPLWLQALQREIGDRVTVQRQPAGTSPGSTIVQDCWIEKIDWVITPMAPWRVRWQLSPAT